MDINMGTDFTISGNSYTQCWGRRFTMTVTPFDLDYWHVPMSVTEEDNVDLDRLVGGE